MKRAAPLLVWLTILGVLASCQEPEVIRATQVVITLRGGARQLTTVEATTYDVSGARIGSRWTFDLASRPFPFSFSVGPTQAGVSGFMLVLSGVTATDGRRIERKAVVPFTAHATLGIELWLDEACLGMACAAHETCAPLSPAGAACGPIPTLQGVPIRPGTEIGPVVAPGVDAGPDASRGEPDASRGDAALTSPVLEASVGASVDAAPVQGDVCLGTPGQVLCVDTGLVHCSAQGQIEKQEPCQSARQCQFGIPMRACAPCDPGRRRCTGSRLERCTEDGARWDLVKTCESEPLCNAIAGDCVAGACTASTRVCMSDGLYGCNQDLTQLTRVTPCSASLCDPMNGECDVCLAGSRTCSSNVSEVCDSRGQGVTRTACTGATPRCSGAGQCVQCTASSDCPAPTNTCLNATCNTVSATCGTTPRAAHSPCGSGVCDGSGACVGCLDESDCRSSAPYCLDGRCAACRSSADCPADYVCSANQTCQRFSIVGSAKDCVYFVEPSSNMCGAYYCGATPAQFDSVFSASSICGPSAYNCRAPLFWVGFECTFNNAPAPNPRAAATECARYQATTLSSVTDACINCFLNEAECCMANANCYSACLNGRGTSACDNARRASGCLTTLFNCTGLPNPL